MFSFFDPAPSRDFFISAIQLLWLVLGHGLQSRDTFLNHLAQTTPFPSLISVDSAEGIYIYDTDNKRYTDLISGIGVSNIGHRHPDGCSGDQDPT